MRLYGNGWVGTVMVRVGRAESRSSDGSYLDDHLGAAWTSDGRFVVTADAMDGSVLIWNAATGSVVDRLRLPDFRQSVGLVNSIRITPDGHAQLKFVSIEDVAPELKSVAELEEGRAHDRAGELRRDRQTRTTRDYDLDLTARRIVLVNTHVDRILSGASRDDRGEGAISSPDGSRRLESDGFGFDVVDARSGATKVALTGRKPIEFNSWDIAPNGRLAAHLEKVTVDGEVRSRVGVLDMFHDLPLPAYLTDHKYYRAEWIDDSRYAVFASHWTDNDKPLPDEPTIIVDGQSGAKVTEVPARCLMTRVGRLGAFAGSGETCGDAAAGGGGLWMFDASSSTTPRGATGGVWRRRDIAELKGRSISALAASEDGHWIALKTAEAAAGADLAGASILIVSTDPRGAVFSLPLDPWKALADKVGDQFSDDQISSDAKVLTFSADGRLLFHHLLGRLLVWDPQKPTSGPHDPRPERCAEHGRRG